MHEHKPRTSVRRTLGKTTTNFCPDWFLLFVNGTRVYGGKRSILKRVCVPMSRYVRVTLATSNHRTVQTPTLVYGTPCFIFIFIIGGRYANVINFFNVVFYNFFYT